MDIETMKRKLLVKYPFFGSVVANSNFISEPLIETMGTDGQNIYYNPAFLKSITSEQQIFVFAHEICHIAFNHIFRSEGKDKELWNIATDSVVNAFLVEDGLPLIEGGIDIPEAIHYDAEEMYEKLLEEKKEKQQNNQDTKNNQSKEGSSSKEEMDSSRLESSSNSEQGKDEKQNTDSNDTNSMQGQTSENNGNNQDTKNNQSKESSSSKENMDSSGSESSSNSNQGKDGKTNEGSNTSNDRNSMPNQASEKNQNTQNSQSNQDSSNSSKEEMDSSSLESSSNSGQGKGGSQNRDSNDTNSMQNQTTGNNGNNQDTQNNQSNESSSSTSSSKSSSDSKQNETEKQDNRFYDMHSMWEQAIKKKHQEEQKKKQQEQSGLKENGKEEKQSNELKKDNKKNNAYQKIAELGEKEAFRQNKIERKKQLQELRDALVSQTIGHGNSTNSDRVKVTDIGISKPLIDWRMVLRETIQYDVDWSYKNAFIEDGVVTACLEEMPKPETEIVLDTSGSIDETLLKNFLRECKNILQVSKVKVGCFDTEFYGFTEIRNISDIDHLTFYGGGGTDFDVAVHAFTRRVDNKIIFTDGQANMPKMWLDVIWIVFGSKKIHPLGGKVIQIDGEQLERLYYGDKQKTKSY